MGCIAGGWPARNRAGEAVAAGCGCFPAANFGERGLISRDSIRPILSAIQSKKGVREVSRGQRALQVTGWSPKGVGKGSEERRVHASGRVALWPRGVAASAPPRGARARVDDQNGVRNLEL